MATIVCQGFQSCLQSQILEPRTLLRLKLSCFVDEKRCHYYDDDVDDDDDEKQISSTAAADDDSHCWSFLQAISNNNGSSKLLESTVNKEKTPTYVHPLDTCFKPTTLSDKSLELCTENLGSETGTDDNIITEDTGIFSSSPPENGGEDIIREHHHHQQKRRAIKKVVAPRDFPPPLTTICGGVASIQVRPHREDGRLIIKATKAPSPPCSLFQAERSHGRLRLTLFRDNGEEEIEDDVAAAPSRGDEEDEDEDEDVEEDGDVVVDDDDDFDEELNDGYRREEEEGENGDNRESGGKLGIKKIQRPGRCNEGESEKKSLLNWEALWVGTS